MLHFGAKPPFSFEEFFKVCQGLIPDSDIELLKTVSITGEYLYETSQPTLKKWFIFDTALRNELVKIRAARKRIDPVKYLRRQEYAEPMISRIAMNAQKNPSLPEAERMLDRERWQALDDLAAGHYFDIDFLIVYALKLMMLERWERVRTADKSRLLQEAIA
jgi:hypothetical protein